MELTQRLLEQFVVLAEERHFARAANRLSMSQPPLSQAIQRLERLVGVRLLDRSTRAVELTSAGKTFAADARRLLRGQAAALERARRVGAGIEGDLQLGFISGLSYDFLPRLLREVRGRYPDLRLNLHQEASSVLVELVVTGQIDVAIVRGLRAETPGIDARHLFTERLGAALPSGHPKTRHTSLHLAGLADETFALPAVPALGALAEQVNAACREAGFLPQSGARADSLPGLISQVVAGGCVTLVPEQAQGRLPPGVEFRPLDDRSKHLELSTLSVRRSDEPDAAVSRVLELADALAAPV